MYHYQENFFDVTGTDGNVAPQSGWSMSLYAVGGDPLTAPSITIYSDRAGASPIPGNKAYPNALGFVEFYVPSGAYSRRYYNSAGVYQYAITDSDIGPDSTLGADLASTATGKGASLIALKTRGNVQQIADATGVPITAFGSIGTADDSLVLQAAINALDGTGIPIALTGNVNLRGTVYIGDNLFRFNGYAINCLIDGTYIQRGTASRRTEAMMLTKSAAAAGYGRATVAFAFLDRAVINVTRTVAYAVNTVSTGLLMENVSGFKATDIDLNTVSTGVFADSVNALYIYAGVQGVTIDTITQNRALGLSQGGLFIVSRDAARMTRDINIGSIVSAGDGVDEFVAIYNSADANADISDIHIGSIICTCNGGSGFLVSIFRNVGSFDVTKMLNITVGVIKCEINSLALGTATAPNIIKITKCAPRIGTVEIEFNAAFPGTLSAIGGIRGPDQATQTVLPYIDDFSFRMNSVNTQIAGNADVANGTMDFGRFSISGNGSGWKHGGRFLRTVADARIQSIALDGAGTGTFIAFDGAESVTGYVDGRMNNVYNFRGTHIINTNHITAAGWWFHNATPATNWNNQSPVSLSYEADVRISGAGTISRIVWAQSNPTNPVPVNVRYRASNPSSVTVSNQDTVSGKAYFPTGQYNAVLVTGATALQRGRTTTLTVATGAITPVFEYHLVTNGGVLSDILGPNGGTPYDGQEVTLRATTGGTFTVKHNTGTAGTKTFTGTGADIVVNDVAGARLIYNAAAARWELRA